MKVEIIVSAAILLLLAFVFMGPPQVPQKKSCGCNK